MLRALSAGRGAIEVLSAGGVGRVLAWFPQACYVEGRGGVLVLVGPTIHEGPLYLRLNEALPEVVKGTAAAFSPQGVLVGRSSIAAGGAEPWTGRLPPPGDVRAAAQPIRDVAGIAAAASLLPEPARARALERLRCDDLEGAAEVLGGLGPGLTPSGDDALAGFLFARRALGGRDDEPRLEAIAAAVRTTPISLAFLRWAARGQALGPVHDLVTAAVRGRTATARAAALALGRVGESSGSDFSLGLSWGMEAAVEERGATGAPEGRRHPPIDVGGLHEPRCRCSGPW